MKAIVLQDVGQIEVQDVPEPKIFPDEIKVKIAYSGICGTDTKIIEGKTFGKGFKPEGVVGWPKKPGPVRDDVRIIGQEMRDGLRQKRNSGRPGGNRHRQNVHLVAAQERLGTARRCDRPDGERSDRDR